MNVNERIQRLLILVPKVARAKNGVPVDELADGMGISPDELLEELDFLMLVGKPPFSPGDFLDLYVEDDRVYAALSQSLTRPPRLTHDEALALAIGAQTLLTGDTGIWGEELKNVLAKLENAMVPAERERYRRLKDRIVLGTSPGPQDNVHQTLRQAVERRRTVRMTYYSANSESFGEREVHPYGLLSHQGYFYLIAGPDGEDGYKIFRFDRIKEVELGAEDDAFEVPAQIELDRITPIRFFSRAGEPEARVKISAGHARYVRESFAPEDLEDGPQGSVIVRFPDASHAWVSSWVLTYGPDAEVLEPPALKEQVQAVARRTLARYASGP